ncbi:hypothetical protein [Prauserella flavalba]|uniref:hypothetical protein n=1 Tax=Prauserella flavalba TaxID=1477506 RepID=UPI0036EF1BE3
MPAVEGDPAPSGEAAHTTLLRTVAVIEQAGYTVDAALWPQANSVSCTGCHNGCHDDPPPACG